MAGLIAGLPVRGSGRDGQPPLRLGPRGRERRRAPRVDGRRRRRRRRRRREHDARAVRVRQDRRGLLAHAAEGVRHDARLALREPAAWRRASRCCRWARRPRRSPSSGASAARSRTRFALASQKKAAAAIAAGAFDRGDRPGARPAEEGRRRCSSRRTSRRAATRRWRRLAKLQPAFRKGGTVTAGNSSPINDGAAGGARRERGGGQGAQARARSRASWRTRRRACTRT